MKDIENKIIKSKKPYIWALICVAIIILFTIGLKIVDTMWGNNIAELNSEIEQNKSQVIQLNDGSSLLQVSHLLKTNSAIIEKLEKQSKIVVYINHLRQISSTYNIGITGFEYSGETLWVNVTSTTQTGKARAYQNIVEFLREYEVSKTALFRMDRIASISWHDSLRFAVNFLIK